MLKVVTNTFGLMEAKEFTYKIRGLSEFEWRTNEKIIKLIEKRQQEMLYLHKLKESNSATSVQLHRLRVLNEEDWFFFRIDTVDTSKPWLFVDYDTSIRVKYIDVVDEKINFYGFI